MNVQTSATVDTLDPTWPSEVGLILSALDSAGHSLEERRHTPRMIYRVTAMLRLFIDDAAATPRVLYTRDINARGLGFITPHRLPLGYGGIVELPDPGGRMDSIYCTLLRCREAAVGWFEGALYFNREQRVFAVG